MSDGVRVVELFRFEDAVQRVLVEVDCGGPLPGGEPYHRAVIVVESGFVSGRVALVVSPEDLDAWDRCLDALAAGEGVEWPEGERSAWLDVVPDDPFEVTVQDAPATRVAVRVPVEVGEEWLRDNRRRAAAVRAAVAAGS